MTGAGRPTERPRLRDLDPIRVAESVCRAVLEHVSSTLMHLDVGMSWSLRPRCGAATAEDLARGSSLGIETQALTRWAQTGRALDWTDSGMAADGLLSVLAALYTRAADGMIDSSSLEIDADPETDYGVVILAAQARIRLCQGQDVPVRELAALASLSMQAMRAGEARELRRTDDGIACEDARRWLSGRGIIVEREVPRAP